MLVRPVKRKIDMTELTLTSDVAAAIAARDAALKKYEEARILIDEANGLCVKAHHSFRKPEHKKYRAPGFSLMDNHFKGYPATLNIDKVRKDLDKVLWRNTLESSGLSNLMSKSTYDDAIDSLERITPEFNRGNVNASYTDFASRLEEIENTAIIDLFRSLSWSYKSNLPVKIGKRIILTGMVWYSSIDHRKGHYLNDLEKSVCRCRNLSPPVSDVSLLAKVNLAIQERQEYYEDEIYKIRWFGNGNLHLYLLDEFDRDSLNRKIAKAYPNALPRQR